MTATINTDELIRAGFIKDASKESLSKIANDSFIYHMNTVYRIVSQTERYNEIETPEGYKTYIIRRDAKLLNA